MTTTCPAAIPLSGQLVYERIRRTVRAVGGPTMGADPIAAAVAYHSATTPTPLPWFSILQDGEGSRHRRLPARG